MRPWLSLVSAVMIFVAAGAAQQPTDIADIGARSGLIFRGTVLAVVTEVPRAPGEVATTRATFRVEDGIRGVTTGETLTIRQWNVANEEYRAGETLLLFLYEPSEMGITSPVGGRAGHRRAEEVSVEVLNGLRGAPSPLISAPLAAPETEITSPVGGRAGHRRVDDVPAEVPDRLRSTPGPVISAPAAPHPRQRPRRPARSSR